MKRLGLFLAVIVALTLGLVAIPAHASKGGQQTYGPVPWPGPYFVGQHPLLWQPGLVDDQGRGMYLDGAYPIASVVDNGTSWSLTFGLSGGAWVPMANCTGTWITNSLGGLQYEPNPRCVQFVSGYQVVGYNAPSAKPAFVTFPDGSSGWYASVTQGPAAVGGGGWPVNIYCNPGCSLSGPLATSTENSANMAMAYSWAYDSWDAWNGCFRAKQGCPNPKPLE